MPTNVEVIEKLACQLERERINNDLQNCKTLEEFEEVKKKSMSSFVVWTKSSKSRFLWRLTSVNRKLPCLCGTGRQFFQISNPLTSRLLYFERT